MRSHHLVAARVESPGVGWSRAREIRRRGEPPGRGKREIQKLVRNAAMSLALFVSFQIADDFVPASLQTNPNSSNRRWRSIGVVDLNVRWLATHVPSETPFSLWVRGTRQ